MLWQNRTRFVVIAIVLDFIIWRLLQDIPAYVSNKSPAWEGLKEFAGGWGENQFFPSSDEFLFIVTMTVVSIHISYLTIQDKKPSLKALIDYVKSVDFLGIVRRILITIAILYILLIWIFFQIYFVSSFVIVFVYKYFVLSDMAIILQFLVTGLIIFSFLYVYMRFLLVIPAVAIGRINIRYSFRQSWTLTSNYQVRMFIICLPIFALIILELFVENLSLWSSNIPDLGKVQPFLDLLLMFISTVLESVLPAVCYVRLAGSHVVPQAP